MIKKTKKMIAVLCVVVIGVTSALSSFPWKSVQAENSVNVEALNQNFEDIKELDPTWTKLTPEDFTGFKCGEYTGVTGELFAKKTAGKYTGSLEDTVFSMDVYYSSNDSDGASIKYGATQESASSNDGLWLLFAGDTLYVYTNQLVSDGATYTIKSSEVGLGTTFENQTFNLKISLEFNGNDAVFGLWFNDVLYNNQYITVSGAKDAVGTYCAVELNNGASMKVSVSTIELNVTDFGYEDGHVMTLANNCSDGHALGTSTALLHRWRKDSLDKTLLNMDITFSERYAISMCYGNSRNSANGLIFRTDTDNGNYITLDAYEYGRICTITEQQAKTALLGKEFNLKISVEFTGNDADADGKLDDVKLGVWINNELYQNQYFNIPGYASKLSNGLYFWGYYGGSSVTVKAPTDSAKIYDLGTNWTEGSVSDIKNKNVEAYDVYYMSGAKNLLYNATPISATVGEEYYLTYKVDAFADGDYTYGLSGTCDPELSCPYLNGKGFLYSATCDTDTQNDLFLKGYTYFIKYTVKENNTFDYTVTRVKGSVVERLSSSVGQGASSMKNSLTHLGLYLEGTREFSAKLSNVRFFDKNGNNLGVSSNNYRVIVREGGTQIKTTERYNLGDGEYLLNGVGPILVNGEEYRNGDTLTQEGTYVIESCFGLYHKTVELYNTGKKSTALSYGDKVMPIVGCYGPYQRTDAYGKFHNTITDEVFKLIKDVGVNTLYNTDVDWVADKDHRQQITESLLLAEKYGIGVYVNDNSLAGLGNFAGNLDFYNNFNSYKGLFVVDEPGTAYYASHTTKTLATYADTAQKMNIYSNLLGYINLYAKEVTWEQEAGAYNRYLDDYVTMTNARHLSFDRYVFPGKYLSMYFENLAIVREKAASSGIPFWSYIQTGYNWTDEVYDKTTNNVPTEGEFLWNVNTSLAYGAKGIQYFTLIQPDYFSWEKASNGASVNYDYKRIGLIGANGEPTGWYKYAKKANAQIAAIDEVLMESTSLGVIAEGWQAKYNTGCNMNSVANHNIESITTSSGAVVGVFDYQGKKAYYVVNYNMSSTNPVTLNFTEECQYRLIQNAQTTYGEASSLPLSLEAGEGVLVVIEDHVIYYNNISQYRTEGAYTAPVAPEGYVFAGWYEDETCEEPLDKDDTTTKQAYAKFVDENLLQVKAQITPGTTKKSPKSNIRFLTSVDTLNYSKIGFKITIGNKTSYVGNNQVYQSLQVTLEKGETFDKKPWDVFCASATRFKAFVIQNVPNSAFGREIKVTPYWVTQDGTMVYGAEEVKTILQGIDLAANSDN